MGYGRGNHHPLAFATGQPVRKLVEPLISPSKANPLQFLRQFPPRWPGATGLHRRLLQLGTDRQMRRQRG